MATIYTRAKAAKRVIDLFESQCGISRSKLNCDARLESDLGVYGDDVWELLDRIESDGVDMSDFDCQDWISPEGQPILPFLIWLVSIAVLAPGFLFILPSWPDWIVFIISFLGAIVTSYWACRAIPQSQRGDIRVRDLILSIEAGRWISPKAEQDDADKPDNAAS